METYELLVLIHNQVNEDVNILIRPTSSLVNYGTIEENRINSFCFFNKGKVYEQNYEFEVAEESYRHAIELDATNFKAYLNLKD